MSIFVIGHQRIILTGVLPIDYMYARAALSFGLIRVCRSGLVLYCSVLSDAGGQNDGSSAIFEISLLPTIRLSWTEFCNCFKIKKIQELCVNKRLSKQSRHRWFKKPSRSLWRHCIGTNGYNKYLYIIQNSIPEMSHERHGFPDHRLFECLLNNSFRLTSEKHHLTLLALC